MAEGLILYAEQVILLLRHLEAKITSLDFALIGSLLGALCNLYGPKRLESCRS